MTIREASTTFNTSGYSLFQTVYTGSDNRLSSFTSGENKIEKYIKNDYSAVGYKKIPSPFALLTSNTYNKVYSTTDALVYTDTSSTGVGSFDYLSRGCYFNGNWYITGKNGSSAWRLFKSDGASPTSWTEVNSNVDSVSIPRVCGNNLYLFNRSTNEIQRSTNGTSWTAITGENAYGMAYFSGKVVKTNAGGFGVLEWSLDDGVTIDQAATQGTQYGTLIDVITLTIGGQERLYFLWVDSGTAVLTVKYITALPSNGGTLSFTSVGTNTGWGTLPYTLSVAKNADSSEAVLTMGLLSGNTIATLRLSTCTELGFANGNFGPPSRATSSARVIFNPNDSLYYNYYVGNLGNRYVDRINANWSLTNVTSSFSATGLTIGSFGCQAYGKYS